eukprot:GHVU01094844.1.p1 GENE.GHVU01094844.1~~GHVU01094844.1.p1  ORF type:complete len:175 (+),score=18.66 GHVU01094844.1:1125-1649(+)
MQQLLLQVVVIHPIVDYLQMNPQMTHLATYLLTLPLRRRARSLFRRHQSLIPLFLLRFFKRLFLLQHMRLLQLQLSAATSAKFLLLRSSLGLDAPAKGAFLGARVSWATKQSHGQSRWHPTWMIQVGIQPNDSTDSCYYLKCSIKLSHEALNPWLHLHPEKEWMWRLESPIFYI